MLQHCGGPRRGATSVYESGVSGGNIIKRLFLLNFTTWWHRKDGAWEVKLSCHIFPCEVTWKFLFPVWFQPRIDVTVTVMRKFLINQRECGFNTCLWYSSRCAKLVAKRGRGGTDWVGGTTRISQVLDQQHCSPRTSSFQLVAYRICGTMSCLSSSSLTYILVRSEATDAVSQSLLVGERHDDGGGIPGKRYNK